MSLLNLRKLLRVISREAWVRSFNLALVVCMLSSNLIGVGQVSAAQDRSADGQTGGELLGEIPTAQNPSNPQPAAGLLLQEPSPTANDSSACSLYPIALSAGALVDVEIGETISDIFNGTQPGNFGWLTWAGSPSVPTLVESLTPPGNSHTYVNPNNPTDNIVSTGDWVPGKPGVSNSSSVRQALDTLKTIDIDVPVWDTSTGNGSNTQYHIVDFARIRLTDYKLPGQTRISARFLGYSCGSGTPTPTLTPTSTETSTPTLTPTAQDTPTETPTPTDTSTPTFTPTPTDTHTPTFTPTDTASPTFTPTDTSTPTPTPTATIVLPPGVSCFDWHGGAQHGWSQSPWMDSAAQVRWNSNGMVGFASVGGTHEAGAFFQFPEGSAHKLRFTTNGAATFELRQGALPPTADSPLTDTVSIGTDGSYFITQPYIELAWTFSVLSDPGESLIFEGFCHGVVPATSTPTATSTPANQAPAVNAGPDQAVTLPATSAILAGIVSDDGLPTGGTLLLTWSKVSGPGTVSFSDPNAANTTALFSLPGAYVLKLSADDGELTASDNVSVTIHDASDLVVQSVDTSSLILNGQTLQVTGLLNAEIANIGSGQADGSFSIAFFEDRNANGTYEPGDDNLLGTAVHADLEASTTVTVSAVISASVEFRDNLIYAFVDSQLIVPETDESNNLNDTGGRCEFIPSTTPFNPTLEWQWTGGTTLPTSNQVMMAPAVADLDEDGIPDIIFVSFTGGGYPSNSHLRAISGQGGAELFTVTDPAFDLRGVGSIAVGDIDGDGRYEILAVDESSNRLIAFEHDGTFKWRSPSIAGGINRGGPAIADLDNDGTPEIVVGATVLNSNGTFRWAGAYGRGNNGDGPLSLVADLDMDGIPEVVAGNTAYRSNGTVYWRNTSLTDGFNAVGNFDSDPFPEVVVVDAGKVYLLENNGVLKWGPVSLPGGGRGGAPTIADVDNDGALEIGVAGSTRYTVFETNSTVKWSSVTQDGSSNVTGSSVFDFEADGSAEVIYRDELVLRIYRGSDGTVLWQTPSSSGTTYELPVIADVDADGNTEIVMVSNNYQFNRTTGVQVFGDTADQWVATRQLWNQHTYHITNINDDGSIPAQEANNWEIYNNYRQNVLTSGCVYAQPDLTASYVRKLESDGTISLTARIGNGGGAVVGPNVPIAFYAGEPGAGGELLGITHTTATLQPGQYQDVTLTVPAGTIALPLWVVADDTGSGQGLHVELSETNNRYNSRVYLTLTPNQAPVVDAGPDQEVLFSGPPAPVSLSGTATDDGLPIGDLTLSWAQVSGPGDALFADPASAQTTVTFDQPGNYVLRLTASDADLTISDDMTVTVISTITPTPSPVPTSTPAPPSALVIPGWIGSPENQSTVTGIVPITLGTGVTLVDGTIDYWPSSDPSQVKILASNVSGVGGDTLASLDTTLLPNDSYIIRLQGTDDTGTQQNSGVLVTVVGNYKPGRVRFTITDLTIPVVGLPITIGRTYDSLERNHSADFGNGWSLAIANPRLEEDHAHNVTLTMPDGERVSFFFEPQSAGGVFGFLSYPRYLPEAGEYGTLTGNGCGLVVVSGGQWVCFPGGLYEATEYTYTDPYGRAFKMSDDGTLRTITDLNDNVLTFTPDGITSSAGGLSVSFTRDALGRITQITDSEGNQYGYGYDGNGDLVSVSLPGLADPLSYTYADHFFVSASDPRGFTLITDTYYPDGRLESETDAVGNTFHYAYDLNSNTTTLTHSDGGTVISTYDGYGDLLSATDPLGRTTVYTYDVKHNMLTHTDALDHTTTFTYDANGHPSSIKNPLNQTVVSASYNQFGGPASITDGLGRSYSVSYDANFMPIGVSDSLGSLGGYSWDSHGSPLTRTDGEGAATAFAYDPYGNLTSQTDPLGHAVTYTYDSLGRVLTMSDPLGNTTTYTYDPLGRLLTGTDALGGLTRFFYDSNGNLIERIDPLSRHTIYTYDSVNRLAGTTDPDGSTTTYTYNFRGQVLTQTDAIGQVTRYDYDAAGQLLSVTAAHGLPEESTLTYEYDGAGRLLKQFDPLGHVTSYSYDAAGRLVGVTDALGGHTTNTYDVLGQMLSTTNANGHTTTFTYDVRGRQVRTTYTDGTFTLSSYDSAGRLLTSTDQAGHVTRYDYDAAGRMTAVTTAHGTVDAATTLYSYDNAGRSLSLTDPLGFSTTFGYDDLGRLLSVTDPLGHASLSSYDPTGQLLSSTDANGHTTGFDYDALGRRTQTTFADGSTTSQTYDSLGRPLSITDQNGKTTTFEHDALGRLLSVTNPLDQATSYTYDAAGDLLTMTDANGHQTSFSYDALHRQARKTLPDTSYEEYAYDALGNLISQRLPDGNINTFVYDSMNRLESASYFDGQTLGFSYTANGLREFVSDARGLSRYNYDDQNRLTRIIQQSGQTIDYTYDANGNRLSLDSAAGTVQYAYDAAGRLVHLTDPAGGVTDFAYDDVGLRTQKTLPNGVTTDYSYDELNRLTDIVQQKSGGTLSSYSYVLDAAGNRLSVTEADGSSIQWSYDDAYRLSNERMYDGGNTVVYNAHFTYDPAGNRLSQNVNGVLTNYTYNELDQMLTAGALQYQYDGRGNQIQITNGANVTQYAYDAMDRLSAASLPDGTEVAYVYDADGHRIQQSVGPSTGSGQAPQITKYLWDEASPYGDVIQETTAGSSTSYVLAGTELLSQTSNGVTSYFLQDGQGSTRALSSTSGTVTDTYTYSAYGELLDRTGTTVNGYQYTGQQFDEATSLYSLRARYYNPSAGRFLSQDTFPVDFNNPIELNRYVYTANNPTNFTDPSGNQAFVEYAVKGALIGGAFGGIAGGLTATACGTDVIFGILSGVFIGAGFGAGFGGVYAFAPGIAWGGGTLLGGAQFAVSTYDFLKDMNLCTGTKAVISLTFFAWGLKGSNSYFGKYGWGGLWRVNWPILKTPPVPGKTNPIRGRDPSEGLGTLPIRIAQQIQEIVNLVGYKLYVVGGYAKGKPAPRKDVDYAAEIGGAWEAYMEYSANNEFLLPYAEHNVLAISPENPLILADGYIIFQPGQFPKYIPPTSP